MFLRCSLFGDLLKSVFSLNGFASKMEEGRVRSRVQQTRRLTYQLRPLNQEPIKYCSSDTSYTFMCTKMFLEKKEQSSDCIQQGASLCLHGYC